MRIAWFAHSWLSDWNHGNAHFLRGLARALVRRGHHLALYEPFPAAAGGWSLDNLLQETGGAASVAQFRDTYPELNVTAIAASAAAPRWHPGLDLTVLPPHDWQAQLRDIELLLVHEWVAPELLEQLVALRQRYGFVLVFHDTHHRALSDPTALARLPLAACDAVLVFGASLERLYRSRFGVRRVYTLHEAADVSWFAPRPQHLQCDVIWVGNWGDEERTGALHRFLIEPARALQHPGGTSDGKVSGGQVARFRVHGVRYPPDALTTLAAAGIAHAGYLPNLETPNVLARARLVLHVPRGPYAAQGGLPGIPTIRIFEALACGATLVSAPWQDSEHLFDAGEDYAVARDAGAMTALLRELLADPEAALQLGNHGRRTVLARHTCAHRARELESICRHIGLTCSSSVPA